jgi:hypothetical protein
MNSMRPSSYNPMPRLSDNSFIRDNKCPMDGTTLSKDTIEFYVNDKLVRVCSHECMIRVKNLYNYLRS